MTPECRTWSLKLKFPLDLVNSKIFEVSGLVSIATGNQYPFAWAVNTAGAAAHRCLENIIVHQCGCSYHFVIVIIIVTVDGLSVHIMLTFWECLHRDVHFFNRWSNICVWAAFNEHLFHKPFDGYIVTTTEVSPWASVLVTAGKGAASQNIWKQVLRRKALVNFMDMDETKYLCRFACTFCVRKAILV